MIERGRILVEDVGGLARPIASLFIACLLAVGPAIGLQAQVPKTDGIIESGEYASSAILDEGRIEVHWSFDPESLALGIKAQSQGWVAIGFGATAMMEGADMALGWADERGGGGVLDQFSTGMTGPHPNDAELGGKDSIVRRAWSERDGITTIEFRRPRAAAEGYDKPVSPGDPFIWALGPDDDPDSYHYKAGSGALSAPGAAASGGGAVPAEANRAARLARVLPHAASLVLAFLLMTAGMLIARYGKKNKRWLAIHKTLGYSSAVLGALGLIAGIVMVQTGSGRHLRVPHAWLGAATLLAVAAAPIMGRAIFAAKAHKKEIRALHPWVGRATILLMLATILSGLVQAGILVFQ